MPNAAPLSLSTTRVGNRFHDINVAADKASKRQVTLLLLQCRDIFHQRGPLNLSVGQQT